MRKGAILAAVSFVAIIPTPRSLSREGVTIATIVEPATRGEHVVPSYPASSRHQPFTRGEAFALFREIQVLGDYVGPEGAATKYMTYSLEVRNKIVQERVEQFVAAQSEGEARATRHEMIMTLGELAPQFAQEELRRPQDGSEILSFDVGRLRFMSHISLQFVWEMYSKEVVVERQCASSFGSRSC